MPDSKTPPRHVKVVSTVTADDVADELRRRIQDGLLGAGEWLREARICSEFGVGRSIARSAIRTLADDGLVNLEENRGGYVAGTSVQEVFDLYELRAVLYGLAARLACIRATPQHMARTLTMVDALLEASEDGTPAPDLVHMSEDIFSRLASFAGPDAQRMIASVRRKTRWHIAYVGLAESQDGGPFNHWRVVRTALAARDSAMAAEAAREIFHYMQNEVMRLMISRGYGLQPPPEMKPVRRAAAGRRKA
jgi:DNA-binding GntR family transcriptional regulator